MKPSLQRVFIVPFVLLISCLAVTIACVVYQAGKDATAAMTQKALTDLLSQVQHGAQRYLLQAHTTLKAVAPDSVVAPGSGAATHLAFPRNPDRLEERLWIAAGMYSSADSYVYFGGADGSFLGVNLRRPGDYELRVRRADGDPRSIFKVGGPGQRLALVAREDFDPRTRPWYLQAVAQGGAAWSPLYTDFRKRMSLLSLAKPVYRDDKSLIGVVCADLPLTELSRFLQSLSVSAHGVAFIVDSSEALIASSVKDGPGSPDRDALQRQHPARSPAALIRQAHHSLSQTSQASSAAERPAMLSAVFDSDLGPAQLVTLPLYDAAGLEWRLVAAAPYRDFHGSLTGGIYQSLIIGVLAALMTLVLGFVILRRALADIRKLTVAARSIGTGEPLVPLDISRGDEIGELAQSFQQMELNLRTDRLTHLLNRDSFIAQIDFRVRAASAAHPLRFVLLFIDLDNFKSINDRFGHDEGDRVLVEVGARLQKTIRRDDAAARFGGDEFVVYLHGVEDAATVDVMREKIREVLEQPIKAGDGYSQLGASIGAARYPVDGEDCQTLFKMADTRMFYSKKERKALGMLGTGR